MTTNKLNRSKLALWLALGAFSHQAAAMEEVVVYGTDASSLTSVTATEIRTQMGKYVEAFNHAQKTKLNSDLARLSEAKIQVAAAKIPTRG
jgi:hypothetical protein